MAPGSSLVLDLDQYNRGRNSVLDWRRGVPQVTSEDVIYEIGAAVGSLKYTETKEQNTIFFSEKSFHLLDGIPFRIHSNAIIDYEFIKPIPGRIKYLFDNEMWLLTEDIFDEYGVGQSRLEALQDYISGLISLYEVFEELATEENVATQQQLKDLKQYFTKRS